MSHEVRQCRSIAAEEADDAEDVDVEEEEDDQIDLSEGDEGGEEEDEDQDEEDEAPAAPAHLIPEKPGVYQEFTAAGEAIFISFYAAFRDCAATHGAGHKRSRTKFQTAMDQLETIIKECKEQPHLAAALAKHEGFKVKIEAAVVLKNDCT